MQDLSSGNKEDGLFRLIGKEKQVEKLFYMEGAEVILSSIINENAEMLTDKEIEAINKLKVGQSVYIGNVQIDRIR